jgi:hypothetical protein
MHECQGQVQYRLIRFSCKKRSLVWYFLDMCAMILLFMSAIVHHLACKEGEIESIHNMVDFIHIFLKFSQGIQW